MTFLGQLSQLLLFCAMIVGLVIIPFGLPGVAVIFISVLLYGLATDFNAAIGMNFFLVLCVLTVVAETADNWLMLLGARRFGASSASTWLSLLGGFLGAALIGPPLALVLSFAGPFVGAFLGAFLIVVLFEYWKKRQWNEALRAGWGTLLGRVAGIAFKMMIAVAMVVSISWAVF
jgi:uncharacterized protein YqgC (DUF456 family)